MIHIIEVKCEKTRKPFYIRLESDTDKITDTTIWTVEWAFAVDDQKNVKSPITQSTGSRIEVSRSYPGCPHCGKKGLLRCVCGKIFCFDIQHSKVTCPWCNTTSSAVAYSPSVNLSCSDGGHQGP